MKHQVLVIDDEWELRQAAYRQLEMRDKRWPGFDIELEFLPAPQDLESRLRRSNYSAFIVDVILEKWCVSLPPILAKLGDKIPIALVSIGWTRTNIEEVNTAWEKPNCRSFLLWSDITGDPRGGGITRTLMQLSKVIHEYRGLSAAPSLQDGDPIRILHLSDLQFGGVNQSRLALEAQECADKIVDDWKTSDGPTFIAITGDIAEHGLPAEYRAAEQWVRSLINRFDGLRVPSNRILLVPGNHDVCLPYAAAPRIRLRENTETKEKSLTMGRREDHQRADLRIHALVPYLEFTERIAGEASLRAASVTKDSASLDARESTAWVADQFRHLGIVFYGLNTARPINSNSVPGREVHADSLNDIKERLQLRPAMRGPEQPLVVGLAHHYPLSDQGDRSVTNPADFRTFFSGDPKTALFLHGHAHERGFRDEGAAGYRVVVSSAPSLTVRASKRLEDTLRGFTMIELERREGRVSGLRSWHYEWSSHVLEKRSHRTSYRRAADGTLLPE